MTLPRAVQLTHGVELRVIYLAVERLQATADATGTAILQTRYSTDPDQIWRIERLVVQSTSTNTLRLTVSDGTNTRDYGQMPAAFPQVAEYPQPMTILGGQWFTLTVTGAVAGDVITGTVQYQIVAKVPATI